VFARTICAAALVFNSRGDLSLALSGDISHNPLFPQEINPKPEMLNVGQDRQDHIHEIGCQRNKSQFLINFEGRSDEPPEPNVIK
jgi:hypothetical protein